MLSIQHRSSSSAIRSNEASSSLLLPYCEADVSSEKRRYRDRQRQYQMRIMLAMIAIIVLLLVQLYRISYKVSHTGSSDNPIKTKVWAPAEAVPIIGGISREQFCAERSRTWDDEDEDKDVLNDKMLFRFAASGAKAFPRSCSPEFSTAQKSYYKEKILHAAVPQEGPPGCQDCAKVLRLWQRLSPSPAKTFVGIGAHVGYDIIQLYELWTNFTTNQVWMGSGVPPGCPWFADTATQRFPHVIAFEAMPPTFDVLKSLASRLPFCNLELVHAAVTNEDGGPDVEFIGGKVGDETAHLRDGSEPRRKEDSYKVPQIALSSFAERNNIKHIDFLAIDTEGNDHVILEDIAGTLLLEGRVDLLQFEYSNRWKVKLEAMIKQLDQVEYDCYFIGAYALLRLNGDGCWDEIYDACKHGNILCARRNWGLAETLLAPFNNIHDTERTALLQLLNVAFA